MTDQNKDSTPARDLLADLRECIGEYVTASQDDRIVSLFSDLNDEVRRLAGEKVKESPTTKARKRKALEQVSPPSTSNGLTQMKEHFRGVVWPRPALPDQQGRPSYRYIIVGMLTTDTPLKGLHPNETVLDGVSIRYVEEMGFAGAIERSSKFKAALKLSDSDSVLLSLNELVGAPMSPRP